MKYYVLLEEKQINSNQTCKMVARALDSGYYPVPLKIIINLLVRVRS